MLKKEKNLTGNDRFSGFCVDMLEYVSRMAGFNYIIEMSGGGVYGMIDTETGEWNGLVRELKNKVGRLQGECGRRVHFFPLLVYYLPVFVSFARVVT